MKSKLFVALFAGLLAAASAGAYAARSSENDALSIIGAKIDLAQAVTTAEKNIGGKASRAEYERHKGQWIFDVEVVKGKSVMDVKVDAMNGRVIESKADVMDHDDASDRED